MAKLIFSAITSIDGYIEDDEGSFAWARPDEDVFRFVSGLVRTIGTYLFGRAMYETMLYWETVDVDGEPQYTQDYAALWRATDKVVYSRSLEAVSSARTRLEHEFDPTVIREMKAGAAHDLAVAGPALAAQTFGAGLVDECHLFLMPVSIGSGKPALPTDMRLHLELLDEVRFDSGAVFLRYRTAAVESALDDAASVSP
jgi:dihydrofolate reductase